MAVLKVGSKFTNDKPIASTDVATTSTDGLMSSSDKTKLDTVASNANNTGTAIHGAAAKTTPVDADTVGLIDSAASNTLKKVSWANIKATLKTYFDTLYNNYTHPTYTYTTPTDNTSTTLTTIDFISTLTQTNGHVTGGTKRNLVAGANITITPEIDGDIVIAASAEPYTHPTYDGDDIALDTTTAQVIDTLTLTTDTLGHVTDAAVTTRNLTASDIGATAIGHAHANLTAGNGLTGTTYDGTAAQTFAVASAAGVAGSVGTLTVTADAVGVSLGTTSTTAYRGDYGNTAYTHSQAAHAPSDADKTETTISGAVAKTTLVDADTIPLSDSAATNAIKKITWANIKSVLKTYFDTLYNKYVHPNHTGDVTSIADGATTIAADVVSNTKLSNMAVNTIKGRITTGTGDPEDLTAAQVRTIINVADGAEVNQNAFSNIAVSGQTTLAADGKTDTVTFVAGEGIVLTTDGVTDSLTITSTVPTSNMIVSEFKSTYTLISAGDTVPIGIVDFDSARDFLFVYVNSVYDADYTISGTNIVKNSGTWDAGTIFNFVALIPTAMPEGITATTIKREEFTATASQTIFNLTNGTYITGASQLDVFVNGIRQPASAYTETDSDTITFTSGLTAGDKVLCQWFESVAFPLVITSHAGTHKAGGSDALTAADIGAISSTSPLLNGELNSGENSIGFTEKMNTSISGVSNIDWKRSNKQAITLTENTTLTFTNPSNPCNLLLRIQQDIVGGWTLTMPAIKWPGGLPPTLTITAGGIDILSLYYDGVSYYGMVGLNFA